MAESQGRLCVDWWLSFFLTKIALESNPMNEINQYDRNNVVINAKQSQMQTE